MMYAQGGGKSVCDPTHVHTTVNSLTSADEHAQTSESPNDIYLHGTYSHRHE